MGGIYNVCVCVCWVYPVWVGVSVSVSVSVCECWALTLWELRDPLRMLNGEPGKDKDV